MMAFLKKLIRRFLRIEKYRAMVRYRYDCWRFLTYSGINGRITEGTVLAQIIMRYHVLEKGLTMPNRHLAFGKDHVRALMRLIPSFILRFGAENAQVRHAIGVLREYYGLHLAANYNFSEDCQYWKDLCEFISYHSDVKKACQKHMARSEFYAAAEASFPSFARSRHCVRNYTDAAVPMQRIRDAVELALTAPSACNRQYCKVHCISDAKTKERLLEIQGGNRGFGHLADKVLVLTASLEGVFSPEERNDVFVNGGMFLMNLCYALHYFQIAHCILTWAKNIECDKYARALIGANLKGHETIIALLSCGEAPDEFDLAASPRKPIKEVFVDE